MPDGESSAIDSPLFATVLRLTRIIVNKERTSGLQLTHEALQAANTDPVPGSPRDRIEEWLKEQRSAPGRTDRHRRLASLVDDLRSTVQQTSHSLWDHLRAFEMLLDADPPLNSARATTVRAIVEAVLRISWLLDAEVSPQTHILRVLSFRVDQVEGSERTLLSFPNRDINPESRKRTRQAVDGLHRWIERAGIERRPDRRGRYTETLVLGDAKVSIKWNITDSVNKYLKDAPVSYRLLSGAAHSTPWYNPGVYAEDGDTHGVATPSVNLASEALILLSAADAYSDALMLFVGLDPANAHKDTHFRRRGIFSAMGAEWHEVPWDEYIANSAT